MIIESDDLPAEYLRVLLGLDPDVAHSHLTADASPGAFWSARTRHAASPPPTANIEVVRLQSYES
jgi:hypothetical protein